MCLLSHFHWDHIQGLPFFPPLLRPGSRLDVYAPEPDGGRTLDQVMDETLCPPLFPVGLADFPGEVEFHTIADDELQFGEIVVTSRLVPHLGRTCGFRLEYGGASVAYVPDHQQPGIDVYEATDAALELCRGVDLLIHDAQYTREEFVCRPDWGHCTIDYAVWIAAETGAKTVALYHHDPTHFDDDLDQYVRESQVAAGPNLSVIAAREGETIHLGE